ncbi:c5664043-6338-4590-aa56-5cc333ba203f [Thermothielavioides terrestris]|uniref:C5664043-6338-4590-aa56-5cc333ba203f n=1 Tax=Thermothielavioides terrestris TaxID=2587410 RepID=A0A446BHD0_9PEZI|nr:c5664043-6338-4590-aa56-5cc333ba203f [Thermothielavioides terrestris]
MAATTPTPKFNSKSPTIRRILREAHELTTSPSADYHAAPLETDLFEWHFTLRGPPNSAFERGAYHGRIVLPPSYPLRPPSFRFLTPSGRFETNREICLSISGHHEETWQPAWGIRTALVALRTFMETDVKGQLGGLEAGEDVRRRLAAESVGWRCGVCGGNKTNGEILAECEERVRERAGEGGAGVEEEVVVPAELKMGWRDEMEGRKPGEEGKGKEREGEDEESARLAEGFVQTTPMSTSGAAAVATGSQTAGGSVAAPRTGTVQPAPSPPPVAAGPALRQIDRRVADDVPAWLDLLIVAVAILLAAVVAKVMLA